MILSPGKRVYWLHISNGYTERIPAFVVRVEPNRVRIRVSSSMGAGWLYHWVKSSALTSRNVVKSEP